MCSLLLTTFSGLLVYTECLFFHCPEHDISRPMSRQMQAFCTINLPCSEHDKRDTGHGNVFVFNIGATSLRYIYKIGILYLRKGKQTGNKLEAK